VIPEIRHVLLSHDGPVLVLAEGGESWLLGLLLSHDGPTGARRWAFARTSPGEALALAEGSENVLRDILSRAPVLLYDESPGGYVPVREEVLSEEDLPTWDARLELTPESMALVLASLAVPRTPPSKDPSPSLKGPPTPCA
jgi:hypothetical protein